jgi:hypothetical protein
LTNIAQELTLSDRPTKGLGRETNAVGEDKPETVAVIEVKCNYCSKKGHKEEECRKKKRECEDKKSKKNDKDRKPKNK